MSVADRVLCLLEGRDRRWTADTATVTREQITDGVLRASERPSAGRGSAQGSRGSRDDLSANAVVQGILLGGLYALLACGSRSCSASCGSSTSPTATSPSSARTSIWEVAHTLQHLAVPRAVPGASRDGRSSATSCSALSCTRACARGDAGAAADDVRYRRSSSRTACCRSTRRTCVPSAAVPARSRRAAGGSTRSWPSPTSACSPSGVAVAVLGGLQLAAAAHRRSVARCARPPRTPTPPRSSACRPPSVYARATAIAVGDGHDRRSVPGDPLDVRPVQRPDPADLRVRSGGHRRDRFAVGHPAGRHRARRRADDRREHRPAVLDPRRPPGLPRRSWPVLGAEPWPAGGRRHDGCSGPHCAATKRSAGPTVDAGSRGSSRRCSSLRSAGAVLPYPSCSAPTSSSNSPACSSS